MFWTTTGAWVGGRVSKPALRGLSAVWIAVLSALVFADAAFARPPASAASIAVDEVSRVVFLPPGRLGQAYRRPLGAQGGTPPYRYAVQSGGLPDGLALSGDGIVSGTPTGAGDWSFTARIEDADGQSRTQFYHLRIIGPRPSGD